MEVTTKCVVLLSFVLIALLSKGSALDDFVPPSADDCACPRDSVQYHCTVCDPIGGFATTRWSGTAFDCTANQILLAHSQYNNAMAVVGVCNDGEFNITAQGLPNVTNGCYTSVLTVNIEVGLNGRTVECSLAGGSGTIGSGTLRVAEPLPGASNPMANSVVRDQSFTLSWNPVTNECGNIVINYVFQTSPNGTCGVCTESSNTPSVTYTVEGQNCSITIRADTDNCGGQQGEESEPVVVSFPRPAAPTITGGEVVFDQSQNVTIVTVELEAVDSTAAIIVSDGGVLLDGAITDYLASFTVGLSQAVEVTCSNTTCTSPQLSGGGSSVFVGALARNTITGGSASRVLCPSFLVRRLNGSSLLDVTLVCPPEAVGGCTIRYGVDPSYQTLPFEVRSGEPLQDLTAGPTYYTEATFSLNCETVLFNFTVRNRFETCECPPSALFPGATPDPADTCPPVGYTGGVRSGEDGRACYDGLTGGSTAVFLCDTANADCIGSCQAVCVCRSGDTIGQWSATFESVQCTVSGALSTGAIAGIIVGIVIGVIVIMILLIVIGFLCLKFCDNDKDKDNGLFVDSTHPAAPESHRKLAEDNPYELSEQASAPLTVASPPQAAASTFDPQAPIASTFNPDTPAVISNDNTAQSTPSSDRKDSVNGDKPPKGGVAKRDLSGHTPPADTAAPGGEDGRMKTVEEMIVTCTAGTFGRGGEGGTIM